MDFPRLPTIAAWNCKRGSRSEKDILLASGGTGCRQSFSLRSFPCKLSLHESKTICSNRSDGVGDSPTTPALADRLFQSAMDELES